jgi:hypothetical protein
MQKMASDYMLAYNRLYAESKPNIFKMESSLVELGCMEIHTLHPMQLIMQTKFMRPEYAAKYNEDDSSDAVEGLDRRKLRDPAVAVM